ncbi:hypothetical protein [Stenoxybacter acetivorans]|uniref:hypothetical protein n=1 Tax=Stenoxybacter acetivorans TaxID=422441 RepID=UPI0005690C80|nr:hypothetical protein [Stenoxybacter acetivorans]
MSILFEFNKSDRPLLGKLFYYQSEYSLDFIEYPDEDFTKLPSARGYTSISVDTLQIEIDIDTGKLLYPWGLFPLVNAIEKPLILPSSYYGEIYIRVRNSKLISGVSIDFPSAKNWVLYKDSSSGWIFIGDRNIIQYSFSIEFARNVIASIENNNIVAFWMKPIVEA